MTDTKLTGWWRLEARSPSDIAYATVLEEHTSKFPGTVGSPGTDPSIWPNFQTSNVEIPQDSKLTVRFRPDTTVTEKSSGAAHVNTISIPSRILDVVISRQNNTPYVFPKTMAAIDFTEKRGALASQKWAAGEWYDVFEYVVPAGRVLRVGQNVGGATDVRVMNKYFLQLDVTTS